MATKPSAGELSNIADTAWQGEPRIGTIAARDRVVLRALWNAGYAAGLLDAREVCAIVEARPENNRRRNDCADAIANLECKQNG